MEVTSFRPTVQSNTHILYVVVKGMSTVNILNYATDDRLTLPSLHLLLKANVPTNIYYLHKLTTKQDNDDAEAAA